MADLARTVLYDLHVELGAKMVPFAGYEMPVQYPMGVLKEHLHTRAQAGLFDVSHMGQVVLRGATPDDAARALEALVPVNVMGLAVGRQRYGLFLAPDGGILDDLMIARREGDLFLVVNAARKAHDIAHLRAHLPAGIEVEELADRALLALQGPGAEAALSASVPGVAAMRFMDVAEFHWQGGDIWVSRSGYTGEDGYEVSVPGDQAEALARALLAQPGVAPIGLGARDSLRLEAGLCLYGHDIDTTSNPAEAALGWAIQKVRRTGGARAGGFPGAEVILPALADGPARQRVGLLPDGRAPMREGTLLYAEVQGGAEIGSVTSGAYGPSIEAPMSMGYLPIALCAPGTQVYGDVRGKRLPATVATLPFRPTNYRK
jgi:aminomethyltransferase